MIHRGRTRFLADRTPRHLHAGRHPHRAPFPAGACAGRNLRLPDPPTATVRGSTDRYRGQ